MIEVNVVVVAGEVEGVNARGRIGFPDGREHVEFQIRAEGSVVVDAIGRPVAHEAAQLVQGDQVLVRGRLNAGRIVAAEITPLRKGEQ